MRDIEARLNEFCERRDLKAENERLRTALESIAANTCCDKCREAGLVARTALRLTVHPAGDDK